MIRLQGVSRTFGSGVSSSLALDRVSLEVARGHPSSRLWKILRVASDLLRV